MTEVSTNSSVHKFRFSQPAGINSVKIFVVEKFPFVIIGLFLKKRHSALAATIAPAAPRASPPRICRRLAVVIAPLPLSVFIARGVCSDPAGIGIACCVFLDCRVEGENSTNQFRFIIDSFYLAIANIFAASHLLLK